MNNISGIFRGPRTLAIMPTFRCVASCASCGTLSNPGDRTELTLTAILRGIEEAECRHFANIVFTGGEPTLCWENLLQAIIETKKRGMLTRVVTNAFWATNHSRALEKLQALKAAGLDEINYSTGDEHARFIPLRNIMNAIKASCVCGLKPAVAIEDRTGRTITRKKFLSHPAISRLLAEQANCLVVEESPWMPLDPFIPGQHRTNAAATYDNLGSFIGCDPILQSLTILADGNISSCCGFGTRLIPELIVANIQEEDFLARAIENTENDFMKIWLHYEGPIKILAWAAKKNPDIIWENMYAHQCQACLRIYQDPMIIQTINENFQEKVGPVLSSAWMEEVFIPQSFAKKG